MLILFVGAPKVNQMGGGASSSPILPGLECQLGSLEDEEEWTDLDLHSALAWSFFSVPFL